jgi:hypothetical protein
MHKREPLLLRPAPTIPGEPIKFKEGGCADAGAIPHVDLEAANSPHFLGELHPILNTPKRILRMLPDNRSDGGRQPKTILRREALNEPFNSRLRGGSRFAEDPGRVEHVKQAGISGLFR